jgi:hypothetical protein
MAMAVLPAGSPFENYQTRAASANQHWLWQLFDAEKLEYQALAAILFADQTCDQTRLASSAALPM